MHKSKIPEIYPWEDEKIGGFIAGIAVVLIAIAGALLWWFA